MGVGDLSMIARAWSGDDGIVGFHRTNAFAKEMAARRSAQSLIETKPLEEFRTASKRKYMI